MAEGNVFIAWESEHGSTAKMWRNHNWNIAHTLDASVNLVQFCGGGDINPALYKQWPHPTTFFDIKRDLYEYKVFRRAKELGIPMAGICRGAQILHAFYGGNLWQDIDGHGGGEHEMFDVETGEVFTTNSIHHQCVHVDDKAIDKGLKVLAKAKEASILERMQNIPNGKYPITMTRPLREHRDWMEVEAFVYEDLKILGIQGHPEYQCSNPMLPIHYLCWIEEYILK